MAAAIVWFRRDLRLADNPALAAAIATGLPVVPLFVHAPDEESPWAPGAASRWWLHHTLAALDADLRARGSALVRRTGASTATLRAVIAETGATHVFWNRLYEPAAIARDRAVKEALRRDGLTVESANAALLIEPWSIATGAGDPYRVFTPFWRAARGRLEVAAPLPAPKRLPALAGVASVPLEALALLPTIPWDAGFRSVWQPGEAGAHARLDRFIAEALAEYSGGRDRPDREGTSRLSPHLHFGEISPRQIVWSLARRELLERSEKYLSELGWREFSHHLLFHFPDSAERNLNAQFDAFPWAEPERELLRAWQRGRTGIPIVDAGMRELWNTGWMHNRVRMIVASLLTKNLRCHWSHGARWFWDTLVDADLPNNTQGWQWSAGSGADAAPYFRIFNPVLQGERFDPEGHYVRRWVPELAELPARTIHRPWTLSAATLAGAGLAGTPYARPMVDLAATRDAALSAWQAMRAA